ncbi:class II aldolase/adducin domain protein [Aspergillus uvarum CBS 121591]|uniref:Class II aldolase/adducin domain protein n=1 Tax=Aspergillus uvarum CBS 121591 TaxID=1448315 RepID=A0A319C7Q9_9EURO|nr:class II aldolase/adducin domain protein [Aspergillus uvarum CBS 121591]PYH80011.1 class II aldolase/adducin domain protein [Aspergillus uvarum CBS 121591]
MSTTITQAPPAEQRTLPVVAGPAAINHNNFHPGDAASDKAFQALARGTRSGTLKLRGIPTFTDVYAQRQWMKEHMAAAFRYFGKKGYGDGVSGHISMRDPILKDHFWMNPFAKHFSSIKASDLVLVDADGYVTEGGAQLPINEAGFMIHSEIHKARPDVIAAAHTHSVYGKTWSAFGKPVEMLTQDACNFYGRLSVYDDHGGIALAQDEGRQIAEALGKENLACILQNHGLLTVGRTVDEAAFLFSSLDNACYSQLLADAAAANGIQKKIISDEVAKYTADAVQGAHNFYTEFQPEFELIVEETNGRVLQ